MRNRALGLISILILLVSVLGSNSADAGYWYWAPIKTIDIVQGMYNDDLETYGDAYINRSASDPNNIEIEIKTDKVWEHGYVLFSYDTGKDGLGGSDPTYNRKYRAKVTWILFGFYDDNNDAGTYIRYRYTLYYMQGSTKHIVGQSEYKIDDSDHDYNGIVINQYVESDSNVPSGKILYVTIEFKLSANASWQEIRIEHDFLQGANHIVLDQMVFEEYRYNRGTIPIG